jgi:hypothetical protein
MGVRVYGAVRFAPLSPTLLPKGEGSKLCALSESLSVPLRFNFVSCFVQAAIVTVQSLFAPMLTTSLPHIAHDYKLW